VADGALKRRPGETSVRILFDHQIFDSQLYGGVSRYFVELLRHLRATPGTEAELGAVFSNNAYLPELAPPRPRPFFPGVRSLRKGGHLSWLNRRASLAALRRDRFDLFHPTYYDPWFLPHLGGRPYVVTVYDMAHERFPELFAADDPTRARKAAVVEGAARVLAISESTKRDVVEYLGVPAERVTVVHLAASRLGGAAAARPPGLPERYLLFVGQRGAYKNFQPWVEAIAPLLRQDRALGLVCAGGRPLSGSELAALERLGIGGQVHHRVGVDDADLGALYRHARLFAFPSRFEGFGIPLLEAFDCGCPVVASDRSSLPEVGGDAAAWFDPDDPDSMREVTASVLGDEARRRGLVERGQARAHQFSWARTAAATLASYQDALADWPAADR